MRANSPWAALTADIVDSRRLTDLRKIRDRALRAVSDRHMQSGWVAAPYAVTAWDEFQTILRDPGKVPQVVLDLRREFHPAGMSLRIGVGIGEISDLPAKSELVNVAAGGAALERAREALKSLGQETSALTAFRSYDPSLDRILNVFYELHDAIVSEVTAKQWNTIKELAETEKGEVVEAARRLGRNPSTVVRSLQRARYHLLDRAARELEAVVSDWLLHKNVQ